MKRIIYLIVFLSFVIVSHGQNIEFGTYRLCYDMYWRCHFQNWIVLKADSTYEFTYQDDVQMKTTKGVWKIDSNFVVLMPDIETKNKKTKAKAKTNKEDLVYKCLGTNKILIENGRMLIRYRDDEEDKMKTEYFERIK